MRITPMKIVWGVLAAVVAAVALASVRPSMIPQVAELSLTYPWVAVVAVRSWIALVLVGAAVFFLIIGVIRRVMLGRGRIAFTLALALVAIAGLHAATLFSRGISNVESLAPDPGITSISKGDGSITVLEYNTLGSSTGVSELADLIEENGVDVVALPETSTQAGTELVQELATRGLEFQRFDTDTSEYSSDYQSTVLLVSAELGEYAASTPFADASTTTAPAVLAVPVDGEGPSFMAVHPIAPSAEKIETWRAEIESVYRLCEEDSNLIIAGDFNSTADHEAALRLPVRCTDAGAQAKVAGLGTWPSRLPALLSSPIDRVLTSGGYEGTEGAVVSVGRSDHRGLLVRLTPAG
ncbi:endonuclease/exonuclease/phosphatase family protein [Actinobaculum sp. 313]|uniref:endonuclease/exonuclease/phosphatase family protein n=1 Tax=Actinobaculum sp. 313 TaxID=2495645 RepID=UPI000F74150C|nr:endonuclease/exonuclease/phosphatase family protein [Actinobaculum sp. 313]